MLEPHQRFTLVFDFCKHLATLDTACILLMAGLVERVFPRPVDVLSAESTFLWFVISLIASLMLMLLIVVAPNSFAEKGRDWFVVSVVVLLLAIGGFLGGLYNANRVIAAQRQHNHEMQKAGSASPTDNPPAPKAGGTGAATP